MTDIRFGGNAALQFGHGTEAVENLSATLASFSSLNLQFGHGTEAVENRSRRNVCRRHDVRWGLRAVGPKPPSGDLAPLRPLPQTAPQTGLPARERCAGRKVDAIPELSKNMRTIVRRPPISPPRRSGRAFASYGRRGPPVQFRQRRPAHLDLPHAIPLRNPPRRPPPAPGIAVVQSVGRQQRPPGIHAPRRPPDRPGEGRRVGPQGEAGGPRPARRRHEPEGRPGERGQQVRSVPALPRPPGRSNGRHSDGRRGILAKRPPRVRAGPRPKRRPAQLLDADRLHQLAERFEKKLAPRPGDPLKLRRHDASGLDDACFAAAIFLTVCSRHATIS